MRRVLAVAMAFLMLMASLPMDAVASVLDHATTRRVISETMPDGSVFDYEYDAFGQLTGAVRRSNAAVLDSMGYRYDLIGNRIGATENNASTAYSSNIVNQYTAVNDDEPTYDLDGNMLTNGDWSYAWNGENRLVRAENAVTGAALEFDYDYMGRRIFKKVYQGNALVKHVLFAYDGYKLIAEFDALDGNAQTAGYLWQPAGQDVPLMRTSGTTTEYVMADGNKNVIQLRNASGTVTDSYAYAPFGACAHTGSSLNPFRFSSEYHDDETGLVYYNYRYYNPELGRWTKRDPIGEEGGVNLYETTNNNLIVMYDYLGLWWRSYFGLTSTHEELTNAAFATLVLVTTTKELIIIESLKKSLTDIIIKNNLDTDSGEYSKDLSYHFNRETTTTKKEGIQNYKMTLERERNAFGAHINSAAQIKRWQERETHCLQALENLGRLTHMLQDYYGHGVQSEENGQTIVGTLLGNPDNPQLTPVSYGKLGFSGGHGGFWRLINPFSRVEPGDRADDQEERKTGAINYSRQELLKQLNVWFSVCYCIYDKVL